jgi:hypothetical protein
VPARGRQPAYDEDVNEVFEDDEPPRPQRRRASAQDYNRAYRDYEDGYDADAPRRRGPWPWLAAFAVVALLAAGIIYYYLTFMKSPGSSGGNVPTIEAPQQSPKSAPEPSSNSTLGTQGSAQPTDENKRKQIYDRILGDDEVGGNQVVPTQEQPQVVEPTGGNEDQGAAPAPNGSSGTGDNANDPLPLPLPPPGGNGDQGSLPNNAKQQSAAVGSTTSTATQSVAEPASNEAADAGAPVPGQLPKASDQGASPPPQPEQVVSAPEPLPVKPKARTEKKPPPKKVAAVDDGGAGQNKGVEPLVLVPPAQPGSAEAQNTQTPVAESGAAKGETAAADQQPADQKSKSFFGLGSTKRTLTGRAAEQESAKGGAGNWANSPDASNASAEPAPQPEPQQQVASVAPEPVPAPTPEPAPQQAAPSSGGFVAQLASFRSEAEAMAEFDRLRAKHGAVLAGLSPRIAKANVAGSSRYRLGVGPLATKSAAAKVCNSLIAAGERDCLVRGN